MRQTLEAFQHAVEFLVPFECPTLKFADTGSRKLERANDAHNEKH